MKHSYEIIEAIESYYSDTYSIAEMLRELYDYTRDYKYYQRFEKICEEHKICEKCLEPMSISKHTERRGDNYTFDETLTKYECACFSKEMR